MLRLDASNLFILALAASASLTTAYWLTHLKGPAEAQAASAAVAVEAPEVRNAATQVLKGPDGHYWANALINGKAVRVMVDTGASAVVLTRDDARRLGLASRDSDFTGEVLTASGPAPAARVTLRRVSVGGAEARDVEALVVRDGLPHSLLGMSYLGRLSGFEASPAGLTLRP
jgi:aspartyl protease family protein